MKTQEEILEVQVRLAEELCKPLIIHCVKAYSELIAVRKRTKSSVAWIVHGYNNNERILRQLLDHGFYISVGAALSEFTFECFSVITDDPGGKVVFGE